MSWTQAASDTLQNPTVAKAVAGGTIASGALTAMDWVTQNIGVVASSAGFVLSCVIVVTTIRRHKLEMELLRLKIEDRRKTPREPQPPA